MSALTLFSKTILETATAVTVTSALAANPVTRLYDRDKSPQWKATTNAQQDITVQMAGSTAASALALVNHNINVAGCTIATAPDGVTWTTQATFNPAGVDPYYLTWASASDVWWRLRIPTFASAQAIGEFLLGVPLSVGEPQHLPEKPGELDLGNIQRYESPGGFRWAAQLGAQRARLDYGWQAMSDADWTTLRQAFDDTLQGSKCLLIKDMDGMLRWVEFDPQRAFELGRGFHAILRRQRNLGTGAGANTVTLSFEEAL